MLVNSSSLRRRLCAGVALGLLVVGLVGCASGDSGSSGDTASPSAAANPREPASESSPVGSAEPAPEAPAASNDELDPALVVDTIAAADRLGYGPADESFVLLLADTCRDVAAGATTFAELVAQDVASGAPQADAEEFNAFLEERLCPAVAPPGDQPRPQGGGPAPSGGVRALGVSAATFPDLFAPAKQAACRAVEGTPLGTAVAYTLRPGVTLCLDYVDRKPLGDVQDSLGVVFEPRLPTAEAQKVLRRLLPADARVVETREGGNPPYAPADGSCLSVLFDSAAFAAHMSRYDSDEEFGITYDGGVVAVLYGDRQTADGASSVYDGSVRYASIGAGGHNVAYQSEDVIC